MPCRSLVSTSQWLAQLFPVAWLLHLLLAPISGLAQSEPPFQLPPAAQLSTLKAATIYTSRGELEFELFPGEAPWHVANFKYRADKDLYKNTVFHIFYPDYIIQAGGPPENPAQSAAYQLPPEFSSRPHEFGTLGMARKPDLANPQRNSSGNQFHILLGDAPHMNGAFTVFGKLTKGDEVLSELRKGDRVLDVKVYVVKSAE